MKRISPRTPPALSGPATALTDRDASATEAVGDLIKATNDDISRTRTELIFFLTAVSFIVLTALSISDHDLLVGTNIKLPLFGVAISLRIFLIGSPWLLLALHLPLLLKFSRVREKCVTVNFKLERLQRLNPKAARNLQLILSSNFVAQRIVLGNQSLGHRRLNSVTYFACLYLAPLLTFLMLTVRGLPLHSPGVTYSQAAALFVGILLSCYIRPKGKVLWSCGLAFILTSLFAFVFCIPDSWFDQRGRSILPARVPFGDYNSKRTAFWPTAFLLESPIDQVTGRPYLRISRNLVVTDDRTVGYPSESLPRKGSSEPALGRREGTKRAGRGISLRGRDLRYARLDRSNLQGADLVAADLTGASLQATDLKGAAFGCANRSTIFANSTACTVFKGANLREANLQEADFGGSWDPCAPQVSLSGIDMYSAQLDEADLHGINISGADLRHASLVLANLSFADLVATNLTAANLAGADLRGADATLGAFGYSRLYGTNLNGSRLVAANLDRASLIGADLSHAQLSGASLKWVDLGSTMPPAKGALSWADLSNARVNPPSPTAIKFFEQPAGILSKQGLIRLEAIKEKLRGPSSYKLDDLWNGWATVLVEKPGDPAYRKAISELLIGLACMNVDYMSGLKKWKRAKFTYTELPSNDRLELRGQVPKLPPDERIARLKSPENGGVEYAYADYPETINPVPKWFKMEASLNALHKGMACKAGQAVPAEMHSSLQVAPK